VGSNDDLDGCKYWILSVIHRLETLHIVRSGSYATMRSDMQTTFKRDGSTCRTPIVKGTFVGSRT
jgi:hypothetical protein